MNVSIDLSESLEEGAEESIYTPVFDGVTKSGFHNRVYLMYHGSTVENIASILENGFVPSTGNTSRQRFGDGVYVSRDIVKAFNYGDVTLKLLVYEGHQRVMNAKKDGRKRRWQEDFMSAWVPADSPVAKDKMEETCVRSESQIRVLGVCYGWELLPASLKKTVTHSSMFGGTVDRYENECLERMTSELGLKYCHLYNIDQDRYLTAEFSDIDGRYIPALREFSAAANQRWIRSWDNCLENEETGMFLAVDEDEDDELYLTTESTVSHKFDHHKDGQMLYRNYHSYLKSDHDDPDLLTFGGYSGDKWVFKCFQPKGNSSICD